MTGWLGVSMLSLVDIASLILNLHFCVCFVGCLTSQQHAKCISETVGWLLACLTFQQYASVSQGRICSDKSTCCHTEIEVAVY